MSLLQSATDVRLRAYAPYSRFQVGAALRATSGAVHVGCNVENVAYPEGTCAEAGAIAAMIAAGDTRIAEIFVIADISGSVASFARFTLHLVYAISGQFSKVRSFVFIDGIDEVTSYFEGVEDVTEAVHRVNTEADVVWVDGHSDYGHAFEVFHDKWGKAIGPKTTVIILGDARNNYHASQSWVVKEMRKKARHVYWLNPEPKSYWDTGDSIVSDYGAHCDGVYECRNLRQLEKFVEILH